MSIYFARGLPSAQSLLNYQPPLPTYVRGINGEPVQTFARERRVQLAYRRIPAAADQRLPRRRGQDLLHHSGIDYPGLLGAVCRLCLQDRHRRARAMAARPSPSRSPRSASSATNIRCHRKIREAFLARRIENRC